jgi:hypothetical protein
MKPGLPPTAGGSSEVIVEATSPATAAFAGRARSR